MTVSNGTIITHFLLMCYVVFKAGSVIYYRFTVVIEPERLICS